MAPVIWRNMYSGRRGLCGAFSALCTGSRGYEQIHGNCAAVWESDRALCWHWLRTQRRYQVTTWCRRQWLIERQNIAWCK